MMEEQKYYVYAYLDIRRPGEFVFNNYCFNYEPFYIGQGCGNRMYEHLKKDKRNGKKWNKIQKIIRVTGNNPAIKIIYSGLTKIEAMDYERNIISIIGRLDLNTGPLVNLCDGGGGSVNMAIEVREKISKSLSGENHFNYGKRGNEMPWYGKHHSKETLELLSELQSGENNGMYGKKHTDETKEIIKNKLLKNSYLIGKKGNLHPNFGKKLSKEIKEKMSNSKKGEKHFRYGKHLTNDHKEKLRQSKIKKYKLISPQNEEFEVFGLNNEITKKYNLHGTALSLVSLGKANHHKGWKCIKLD